MATVSRRSVRWQRGRNGLCEAAPCALSRSEHTSAPTPPSLFAAWPEALYRLTLYTRPELAFRLGDRVEVTDEGGSVWMGAPPTAFGMTAIA